MSDRQEQALAYVASLWIVLAMAGVVLVSAACANWDSLKPGVERVCTEKRCYLAGDKEQVDRQCRKGGTAWDDGKLQTTNDGRRARCCTQHFPGRAREFAVWVSREDWDCVAHEECHIEEFKSGRNDHARCEGFGFGKEKKRLTAVKP